MKYVDRIGLFYYTAEGQHSSTSNTSETNTNNNSNNSQQNPSGMPQNQSPNIPATPNHVAGFSEQYGNYNVLPKYKGIETGDKWYNSLFEGIVNYGIIGTYNLCATAINTISNGVGAAYDLINATSETVLGGDLDAITMTMMSNGMLAPAGYILNGFNSYMNGLKLSNTSRIRNVALSTIQTSVNVGAGLVNVDFYVGANGNCVPSIGYRYMDSHNAKEALETGSQYSTYIGFEKFNSAADARNAFQVSPIWSDCKVRGEFNTLQAFDNLFVPLEKGGFGPGLEPITRSYPEFGTGGIQQLRVDSVLKFDNVIILRD